MKGKDICISIQQLLEYVERNEVAWQKCDTLIEFSRAEGYELSEDEKDIYDIHNNEMLHIIKNANKCVLFNPEVDDTSCFEDIIEWSEYKDILVLVDDTLMLCIAPCDKDKIMTMVA